MGFTFFLREEGLVKVRIRSEWPAKSVKLKLPAACRVLGKKAVYVFFSNLNFNLKITPINRPYFKWILNTFKP